MRAWFTKENPLPLVYFPVHMLEAGKKNRYLMAFVIPFYAVESRDYQVIQPNHDLLNEMGAKILCIEKAGRMYRMKELSWEFVLMNI